MQMELTGSGNRLAPGVQVREYHLEGVLGEGGFGIVYRAYDAGLDRTVAIKEYMPSALASRGGSHQIRVHSEHREAFDAGLRSFINEARLLAKFSHPALVHVYRFFEENGTAYMVMRHYEGQTFRAFLAEQQHHIDERWLMAMLSPILDGLEMLHAADCFHRDIAPDNVFLRASGMPVLLDFGAARRIIGDMTQALTMVLKPGYAPIEQYADDGAMPQGAWTDIYQLGAMLYKAITGKVPATSVARMINDPIRMLTPTQYPGYSAQFLRGVHQALSVRPEDRPQSIAELKSLLGVEGFTVSALSAWSASDAVPLDVFGGSKEAGHPGPDLRPGGQAPAARADAEVSQITTVRLADSLINSPESVSVDASTSPANKVSDDLMDFMARRQTPPPSSATTLPKGQAPSRAASDDSSALTTTAWAPGGEMRKELTSDAVAPSKSPVFLSKDAALDEAASKGLWQPPAVQIVAVPDPLPTARATNNTLYWKLGASVAAAALMLAGVWLLSKGEPEAERPSRSVAQQQSWEAAKKAGSAASLQAYLDVYPTGEHAEQARAMLAKLNSSAEPAVTDKPASSPMAQNSTASAAVFAAKPEKSAPAVMPPDAVPDNRIKPTPVPPTANTQAAAKTNTSAPPLLIRPRPEPTKTEASTASLTENKPPAPVEMGTVALKVTPWGQVRVNRSPVGSTPPLTQLNLPEGQHQIEISNPNGSTVTKLVQVTKGEVVVLSHKFD
jgi:non-specific serine/threonine protein kinase